MSPEALSELIYDIAQQLVADGQAGDLTVDLIPDESKFAVMRINRERFTSLYYCSK